MSKHGTYAQFINSPRLSWGEARLRVNLQANLPQVHLVVSAMVATGSAMVCFSFSRRVRFLTVSRSLFKGGLSVASPRSFFSWFLCFFLRFRRISIDTLSAVGPPLLWKPTLVPCEVTRHRVHRDYHKWTPCALVDNRDAHESGRGLHTALASCTFAHALMLLE